MNGDREKMIVKLELDDGIIGVIDLTQMRGVILNNAKNRSTNTTGEKGLSADNIRMCRDTK
jgi:hypothetical protein